MRGALLFALCVGCGAPAKPEPAAVARLAPNAVLRRSRGWLADEIPYLERAVSEWRRATGGSLALTYGPEGTWLVERGKPGVCADEDGRHLGCVAGQRIAIDVEAIAPPPVPMWDELRAVMLHELGHAVGLQHGDGALMEPDVGNCIDGESLAAYCAEHECAGFEPTCEEEP